ncbi:ARM repeat superfamily protein [Striga asiatica]|uniref:ARM repeat superfamily protein n=1 Tax=Striga asiatica TaxID=4170 RepID=A0A5A7PEZ6_STRAF|nr:ARM repeat superfamily protein [Striga asiatica]
MGKGIKKKKLLLDDDGQNSQSDNGLSAEEWLSCAQALVPKALQKAKEVKNFPGRWKMIISKLDQIPSRLSDLSSHPFFSKNALCKEQLQSVSKTLNETIELADLCLNEKFEGKLRMQSDLDSLTCRLDLNLRDCNLLIKTGVLSSSGPTGPPEPDSTAHGPNNIRELLARLHIGHLESKHRALDALVEAMKDDEKDVLANIGRAHVSALVQLLSAMSSPRMREKAAAVACQLAESGGSLVEGLLVSEGALPPLIRLIESGGPVGRERAVVALQRLSGRGPDAARSIVGHGGARPLIELCRFGDSVSQSAAACALKNVSAAVPEARRALVESGLVRVMIDLLDRGILLGSREHAAECLQSLTSGNDELRRAVISEGGVRSLLSYLDGPLPQESAVGALKNLIGLLPNEVLVSGGVIPRLAHVLQSGSPTARQAAAWAIVRICSSSSSVEMKKLVGQSGCIPNLVRLLEEKSNGAREVGAHAISCLMSVSCNCREVKKEEKSVPSLVALLDPSQQNTAKKYAVTCLGMLCSSKKCRKLMVSYGAIGYLKKLSEMDVAGAKKLLERLERGRLKGFFGRK